MYKLLAFLIKTRFNKTYLITYIVIIVLLMILIRFFRISGIGGGSNNNEEIIIYSIIILSGLTSLQLSKSDIYYLLTLPISPKRIYFSLFLVNLFGLLLISILIYIITVNVIISVAFAIGISSLSTIFSTIKRLQIPFRLFVSGALTLNYYFSENLFVTSCLFLFSLFLARSMRVNSLDLVYEEGKGEEKKKNSNYEERRLERVFSPVHFHFLTFSILITLASMGSPGAYRLRVRLYHALIFSSLVSAILYFLPKSLILGYIVLTLPLIFTSGFFITAILGEERLWLGFQNYNYAVKVILLRGLVLAILLLPHSIALWILGLTKYAISLIPINLLAYLLYLRIIPMSFPNIQKIFEGEQPMYISFKTLVYPLIVTLFIASLGLLLPIMSLVTTLTLNIVIVASFPLLLNKRVIEDYIQRLSSLGYE